MVKVRDYLSYLKEEEYPQLFSKECMHRLNLVEQTFGELESEETILEVLLDKEARTCDYSIKIQTVNKVVCETVQELWYELDYGAITD
ncbi:MAG: hypothetical protein ACI4FV_09140, partial [Lachnospiraceae bacterium]